MKLIEELKWRGMVQDSIPGTEEFLDENKAVGYIGFDPTAASLGIGNMVQIMLLTHFQRHGHHPIALVGGATGRIGDPSGKSDERKLLGDDELEKNIANLKEELSRFLDFDRDGNPAKMVDNYDWFKDFSLLDFLRDVGKHLTVNYMASKDSVKSRMEGGSGISFTEFSYQLIQGYDFYHLHKEHGVDMQFGGSDQWGNITAGTELIRRMMGSEEKVYAFTCPLITKADGTKFGKSEAGNIFLNPEMTSPFKFYQFWIQNSDADIVKLAKIFSLKSVDEIQAQIDGMAEAPNSLQRSLAEEMTERIHGREAVDTAIAATKLLFGKAGLDDLKALPEAAVADVFEGVAQGEIARGDLAEGVNLIDFLAEVGATSSKGDARRKITKDKCISINTAKVTDAEHTITAEDAINDHFILINIGKKNRHLVYLK